ncbi:TonB-dependent receptor plug domain-containing protein [Fodinibius sediminis]|uniref:Iron complex outermembrane recepter protein n=1 Tax=Fodinibius sediminis TaxID=1214077 RepID=A0A521CM78_9BACT|nr:TonB-dependent receptor [Fodinibius sediminis]SMO60552.1 iron complex outermembrane recepter protein [Fodinibius sediminis]
MISFPNIFPFQKQGIIIHAFALWLVFCALPVMAQQAETLDTMVVSRELVVSSSRIPQTAAASGRNLTIIPYKTIQSMPVHTVDEVIRYVSGVEVQSRGAFGTQSDFSIRGSTFSQVLVMVDGVRINDPLTAHFNSNIPVAPSEIERIEVLHGPAAAQYGADAVGGVINIITRTFAHSEGEQVTSADARIGYGQDELKMGQGGFFHRGDNFRIGGGGMWYHTPGQSLGEGYRNRFSIGNASLSAGFHLGHGWDLAARTAYDDRDFNARYFYTVSPYDEAVERVTAWWNQLQLTQKSDRQVTTLKGSFKHNADDFVFNPEFPANHHTTNLLNLQLYQYRSLSSRWEWTYGAQMSNRFIRSNDRGRHNDWHYAGFSMVQWKPRDPLTLTGSLRLDHDENYGTELMPQLSASYEGSRWILRASGGRSIRSASYTERYISNNLEGPLAGGRNIGNPWLKAERSWSGEAGLDLFPVQNLRFSATGFIRSSSNLIDYVLTNSGNIRNNENLIDDTEYLYANNLSSVRTAGIETELSLNREVGSGWILKSRLGYTFADALNKEKIASKYISNYARHLVNGMLALQQGALEVALNGLWKQRETDRAEAISAYKSPSYSVWNLKIGYTFYKNVTLGLEVDNVFDERYQDILGARMPGRWAMGTLSWEL